MAKDPSFNFPALGETCFGRALSCACGNGVTWVAAQMEARRANNLLVVRRQGQATHAVVLECDGHGHQPVIVARPDGGAAAVWNEKHGDQWHLRCATIGDDAHEFDPAETVASSDRLFLPPSAAFLGNDLWVCWPAVAGDRIRVRLACRRDGRWDLTDPVSPDGVDAFRPSIAASRDRLFVVWDQYRNGTYQVGHTSGDGTEWAPVETLGGEGERWFCARVVATPDGTAYLIWVVLKEVTDGLGIVDHFPFAMAAVVGTDGARYLCDAANSVDTRIVADMREGLLASGTYKGYHGLRRNPYLSLSDDGALWCLWEARIEAENTHIHGHLAGRMLDHDESWTAPRLFHSGHYSYCVPPRFTGHTIPVGYIHFGESELHRVAADEADLTHGRPYEIEPSRWARWSPAHITRETPSRHAVDVDGKRFYLYWADTHCHSNVSPDAEGEPDELIHFARDVAGLDAVCVIDNDFYPHKSLTEAEWQVHQEYARHFTRDGEFVVFPGWEFTFHRKDLPKTFNHRTVLCPGPGTSLFRRIDAESSSDKALLANLRGTGAACFPHHCTYELIDPTLEWNVEVCSSWRVCIEEIDFSMRMLREGHRFGFVGASDTHRAVPGLGGALTGIYAEALTPEALFDAYRHRRTFATQGSFVHMDFHVGGAFIGGESACDGAPTIEARVEAPTPIEFAEVIRDGAAVHRETPDDRACAVRFTDTDAEPGAHFYVLRVKLVGDPSFNTVPDQQFQGAFVLDSRYPHNLARARGAFAWTSPVWVKVGP